MRQPSSLLYGTRLAQQYGSSKDCQRSCSVLHDGVLHAPFPTNTPLAPRLLSLPFPLFQGHGFGTGPPAGGLNWNALISRSLETSLFPLFLSFFFVSNELLSLSSHCWSIHEFSRITQPAAWVHTHFKNGFLIDLGEIVLIRDPFLIHSLASHYS